MTLGQKIKQARENKNLSQEELAEKLGVSRQAVSKWENDTSIPQGINREVISLVLDLDLASQEAEIPSNHKSNWFQWLGWSVASVVTILLIVAVLVPSLPEDQQNTISETDTSESAPAIKSITFYDEAQKEVKDEALWYDTSKIESILIQWDGGTPSSIKMFFTPSGSETMEMTELLLTKAVPDGDLAALLSADSLKNLWMGHVHFELDFGETVIVSDEFNMTDLSM